jgi:O-acetyl-ADP-ribose deacetylase
MKKRSFDNNITIFQGDITLFEVDAVVNAANTSLLGGGGVDGAIHRAAGPELYEACKKFNGCSPGEAVITPAFNMKAAFIIHTPGPIYHGGTSGEAEILTSSYRNSMKLAQKNNCSSIAFPAISTGVYHYPKEEACHIAVTTCREFILTHNYTVSLLFVLYDDNAFNIYEEYFNRLETL